jgi:iron(III) transport system ATP-binding protein
MKNKTFDPILEVNEVSVAYDQHTILEKVSFQLETEQLGCLLGPSGCGKSTLLRAIAGFESIQTGSIALRQRVLSDKTQHIAPEKRRIGMVFQDFALFPHLNIADNIAFGLRHLSHIDRRERIKNLLALVGLSDISAYHPHQLSGGQQQRIALARAMAPHPDLLLLDEPFSSMDTELREQLASEVRSWLKQEGISAMLVTHDQMEAFAIADKIGVMGNGHLHQWDSSYQIYHAPKDQFVAEFVGQGVLLVGEVIAPNKVKTVFGTFSGDIPSFCETGCPVKVLLRPDDIIHDDDSSVTAEVVAKRFRGSEFLYTLRMDNDTEVLCFAPSHHDHALHTRIGIHLDIEHLVVFPDLERLEATEQQGHCS